MTNQPPPPRYTSSNFNKPENTESKNVAGYPGYSTEIVSKEDKEKLDRIKQADKSNSYLGVKIGTGFMLALLTLVAPVVLFMIPPYFDVLVTKEMLLADPTLIEYRTIAMVGYTILCIILWAGSIVRCVWDMIKYHSASSAFGLFTLLITPFVWVAITYVAILSTISQFMGSGVPFQS